jgi:hypothetical protein
MEVDACLKSAHPAISGIHRHATASVQYYLLGMVLQCLQCMYWLGQHAPLHHGVLLMSVMATQVQSGECELPVSF